MHSDQQPARLIAAGIYSGDMKDLIARWKFQNRTSETKQLARIAARALHMQEASDSIDVVTWAPTSDRRRRTRGYDQAEELARAVARVLRVPCRRLLIREGITTQTGRSRAERLCDAPTFRARPASRTRSGARMVLVVDDVVTTGSTLRSAEEALRKAGHCRVVLLALARTPGMGSG